LSARGAQVPAPEVNASDKEKQLLLKEARIASSLDHPNVGAIYGIETNADGRTV
jgi:hypothetical protein